MPSLEISLEKFNQLEPEVVLTVDSDQTVTGLEKVAKKYNLEFSFLSATLISLTVEELSLEDLLSYFKQETGLGTEMLEKIVEDFKNEVVLPLRKRLDFLNNNPDKEMKIGEEKNIILQILGDNLLQELSNHPIIINAVNARIIYVLTIDLDFKVEVERVLLSNENVLTGKDFFLGAKPTRPTVGNWIKYFIEESSSDFFDSIVLTKFLTDAKNVKVLDSKEKESVKKVINLYRNLKFYPESMPNDTGENWQILPFEIPANQPDLSEEAAPKEIEEKELPKIEVKKVEPIVEKDFSEEIMPTKINILDKDKELLDLKDLLSQYQVGSLERRVVEEEIKKLSFDKLRTEK